MELGKDFSLEKISTLCVREDQMIKVICFKSAGSLSDFVDRFYIMKHEHTSDLFNAEWTAAMTAAIRNSTNASLSLEDIRSKVWDPTFCNCQSLLQELQDCSMKLSHIDGHFRQHKEDLEKQLRELLAGVNACLEETKNDDWITGVVCRIQNWWYYHEAVSTVAVLNLKRALNLQGDFTDVEIFVTEVNFV